MDSKRRTIPFHIRIFSYTMSLMLIFMIFVLLFQYRREKIFKVEHLNYRLQLINERLAAVVGDSSALELTLREFDKNDTEGLRATIINPEGDVVFDTSSELATHGFNDHSDRPEFIEAMNTGSGYTIRRLSKSTNLEYFYSASHEGNVIVRTAVPYTLTLREVLRSDNTFMWFVLATALAIIVLIYLFARNLGHTLYSLRSFAIRAAKGEDVHNLDHEAHFGNDELGEISSQIVRLYSQLNTTKQELLHEHTERLTHEQEQIRIKKQMTQNINHELKTPVSIILGYLETITLNPTIDTSKKEEFITNCYGQAKRLNSLLADLSTITRMDEGSEMIQKESLEIVSIIQDVVNDCKPQLTKSGIECCMTLPPSLYLTGNRGLIQSIFGNLMSNAIAYSGCTQIDIAAKLVSDDTYQFTIADNGTGVAPEHLSRIFERFYRIDKGRSRKVGGTGLGLSIVKNAVLIHGGTITASPTQGGGLTFSFTLKQS